MMPEFPLKAARGAGRSTITVPVSLSSVQADGTMGECQKPRTVENAAMQAIVAQADAASLTEFEQRLIRLERIAAQPSAYPDERNKPARPLYGMARYHWIARRTGVHWRQVKEHIEAIERQIRSNVRAGRDE